MQDKSLVADADAIDDDDGRVTLMTIHNAKGLEYPVVFMVGMEEGQFPHSRAIEEGNVEEERRLAYVGVTRAMRDLILTYARQRGGYGGPPKPAVRSRFLNELPVELTDQPARISRGLPAPGRVATWAGAAAASAEAGSTGQRDRASSWATTSCTRSSATAWSPASSPAGSWSCASRASPPIAS